MKRITWKFATLEAIAERLQDCNSYYWFRYADEALRLWQSIKNYIVGEYIPEIAPKCLYGTKNGDVWGYALYLKNK